MKYRLMATAAAMAMAVCGTETLAQDSDGISAKPMIAARLRYENVDQDNPLGEANAATLRIRAGGEIKVEGLSILGEVEGTIPFGEHYNNTLPKDGVEPYSVVADPESFEINRIQVAYMKDGTGATIGRQRIIHDDARFVGNVGWRQNEQTFDAIRGQARLGPVSLDAAYAKSQRTIFGSESPNEHFDGDFILLNGGAKIGPAEVKAFYYVYDYDDRIAFSSETVGVLVKAGFDLGSAKFNLQASYASQGDYGLQPVDYRADYFRGELGGVLAGFNLKAGYELLGSDDGAAGFQTPLATLHAFNGWADMFLTTPAGGLQDLYFGAGYQIADVPAIGALNLQAVYHEFDSDVGAVDYGNEWNVSAGFKIGPIAFLAKYASYDATLFGVDTDKLWLQAETSF